MKHKGILGSISISTSFSVPIGSGESNMGIFGLENPIITQINQGAVRRKIEAKGRGGGKSESQRESCKLKRVKQTSNLRERA